MPSSLYPIHPLVVVVFLFFFSKASSTEMPSLQLKPPLSLFRMASAFTKDDSTKLPSVYDPLSLQPLLFSAPPPPQPGPQPESDPAQYLPITYNYNTRTSKDRPFLFTFLLLVLCTYGLGIFSIFHGNTNYSNVSSFTYSSSSDSCIVQTSTFPSSLDSKSPPLLQSSNLSSSFTFNSGSSAVDVKALFWVLTITSILTLPICFLLLLLLKHYAKLALYASFPFFVLMPLFLNAYLFLSSATTDSSLYKIVVPVIVFLVIGAIIWFFVANRNRIELTIRIIAAASDALSKNLLLFGVLPFMNIGLIFYYVPILVFLVFAKQNGEIVPRELDGEYTCTWKQDSWVAVYFALAMITMMWSWAAMVEAQVYVISGTIAQWYFSKDDPTPRRGAIRSSLTNTFGASSGTIFFSGLLIGAVRVVRALIDRATLEDLGGLFSCLLRVLANMLVASVEFLNKFAIIFASITGEGYCKSGRLTYELLKRNLLYAVFVEILSTRLLSGLVFVVSAIYAVAVWGILKVVGVDSYVYVVLPWILLLAVLLGFFVKILNNVIDTVYVYYAIDKDRGVVCKPDIYDVYVQLPLCRNGFRSPLIPSMTLALTA